MASKVAYDAASGRAVFQTILQSSDTVIAQYPSEAQLRLREYFSAPGGPSGSRPSVVRSA